MELTGAQIIIKKLGEHKVDKIFEFPGGSICPILDELYKSKKIKTICFRHEQAAIHAADAYARITKRPSVCMATSGPGAANLVTGIANAFMDSVPVVIITGQVAVWDLKKDRPVRQRGFQELDIVSVVKTITKAAFLVNHVSDLAETIDKSFFIAKSGRPGPVLIDIPINVQYTACNYKAKALNLKSDLPVCPRNVVKEIARKLVSARKPLVIAGGGVLLSSSQRQLMKLLEGYKLPVLETLMGLTSVPSNYELNLGMAGYAGSKLAHLAVKEADFVLGLGLRFDNRAFPEANSEFSKSSFIVHVDCDKHELNHRVAVNKAVFSDVGLFLHLLLQELKRSNCVCNSTWPSQIRSLKKLEERKYKNSVNPKLILHKLSELIGKRKFFIATDVGQHQLWTAQHFKFNQPNALITSGGLGTMGFGLPASIGVQFACPPALVVNITSDGSFQMNIQELATLKDYDLPIKIIILNNKCLGLVRQIQEFAFSKRYYSTMVNSKVDFVKIASSYGIKAFRVKSPGEIIPALKKLISSKESMLIDFAIKESENVFPVRIKGKVIYNNART
ncbi:MAG: biosynthetic-type acetolactate synthase large subunit [Candidatus Omnitrophota bacterium]